MPASDESSRWSWEQRLFDQEIASNADQVEWSALLLGVAPCDDGTRDEVIADAMDDFANEDLDAEDWAESDLARESGVTATVDELDRRAGLLGSAYPFRRVGNSLIAQPSQSTAVYETCLAICMLPSLTKRPWNTVPSLFESLCGEVICRFLGPDTRWKRTGWPPVGSDRPRRFRALIEQLATLTDGEVGWKPKSGCSDDPPEQNIKDGGIDLLFWHPMPDRRGGHFFFAVQCACGSEWQSKCRELQFEEWQRWADPCFRIVPNRGFALPRHIRNLLLFHDTLKTAGGTFDRARIAALGATAELSSGLQDRMREFNKRARAAV